MAEHDIDGLLLTTHPDIYYFTGFLTRFWESPTRPWYLILPQSGQPVAVIPSIGAHLMDQTWLEDIRTWASPDLQDDGVSLLASVLSEIAPHGRIAIPSAHESQIRMPLNDFDKLKNIYNSGHIVEDEGIVRSLRLIKSDAEVEKISHACSIASSAFDRVPTIVRADQNLGEVFRHFQMLCLDAGADWVPYLAGGSGPFGQFDVISPAADQTISQGDILMLDTGLVWDGYFCDFDRNFAMGTPDPICVDAYCRLIDATSAGFDAARPGAVAADVFRAMDQILTGGNATDRNGRMGHGLGIQLTEWPSLMPTDRTVLEPGMILSLEPGIETRDGYMMVHEENIVVTQTGARYLSNPTNRDLPRIGV